MVCSYKYLKQKILFFFKLRDKEEFDRNVIIISTEELQNNAKIYKILEKELKRCTSIIIIKVTSTNRCSLPNFIVKDYIDRKAVDDFLSDMDDYREIWLCLKVDVGDCASGRMRINWGLGIENHIVEIVKGDYPRQIEHVDSCSSNFYAYKRFRWSMHYKNCAELSENQRIKNGNILRALEQKREQLEIFCNYANKVGLCSISIDFLFYKDRLEIIEMILFYCFTP